MKPSDVQLGAPPLVGTMGHSEVEAAASLIVRACQVAGDRWRAVTPLEIGRVLESDEEDKSEPFAKLQRNPFFRPDVWKLVELGFAEWVGQPPGRAPVRLTEKGLAALSRWSLVKPEAGR